MKLKLLLSILAFAVFIGGASIAYNRLSKKGDAGGSNLQIVGGGQGENPTSGSGQNPPAESPTPENPSAGNPTAESPSAENPTPQTPSAPTITPSVPDFTVYDVNGKAVKLSDYFGKPIVLNFFASWCSPCRSEMPAFQAQYEALGSEIAFVFVSVDNTMADAKSFVDGQGYTFPILHDASGSAESAYAVQYYPSTFFIDKNGTLVAKAVGALSHADLATGIGLIK